MNKKTANSKTALGGLKEVREIIFGDVIQNLQEQIDELKKENKDLKGELKLHQNSISKSSNNIIDLTNTLKDSLAEQKKLSDLLESVQEDFAKKIIDLSLTKIDKNQIGQAFIEWGMKVKENPKS